MGFEAVNGSVWHCLSPAYAGLYATAALSVLALPLRCCCLCAASKWLLALLAASTLLHTLLHDGLAMNKVLVVLPAVVLSVRASNM